MQKLSWAKQDSHVIANHPYEPDWQLPLGIWASGRPFLTTKVLINYPRLLPTPTYFVWRITSGLLTYSQISCLSNFFSAILLLLRRNLWDLWRPRLQWRGDDSVAWGERGTFALAPTWCRAAWALALGLGWLCLFVRVRRTPSIQPFCFLFMLFWFVQCLPGSFAAVWWSSWLGRGGWASCTSSQSVGTFSCVQLLTTFVCSLY